MVVPVHSSLSGQFDILDAWPGAGMGELCLVESIDGLAQHVAVADAHGRKGLHSLYLACFDTG